MATIASLAVSLTARIGGFEKGFAKAQKVAGRFASDIGGHVRTVAGYGAAIAGVAAGAMTLMVKNQMAAIDSTSKLSRTLGLSTEALIGYQHAAALSDVSTEALSTAIFKLNKSTDAAFAGMATDERVVAVAERYRMMGSAAERAAYLTELFGRAGMQMGSFFEGGADGLNAARLEAIALGKTFSSAEALGVEAANDAVTKLLDSINSVAIRIATTLAPYIQVIADRMTQFAMNGNDAGQITVNAIDNILRAAGKLADYIDLLRAGWNYFAAAVSASAVVILSPIKLGTEAVNKFLQLLGVEPTETAFDAVFDGFMEAAEEATKKANALLESFAAGTNSKKAAAFFQGIQIEARKAAEAAAGIADASMFGDADPGAAAKMGEFRQVDINRIAIGGGLSSTDKPVTKAQGQQQIELLRQVARNTSGALIV